MSREPGPLLALVQEPVATHAAEELAGLKRLNKLRAMVRTAFNRARKAALVTGQNPATDIELRKVPRRAPAFLELHEVPLVLAELSDSDRRLIATALYAGLRKGEMFGLRKRDVDIERRLLMVRRSYDRESTRRGGADRDAQIDRLSMVATAGETPQPQPPEQPARAATAGFAAPVLRDDAIGAKGRSMLQKNARTPRHGLARLAGVEPAARGFEGRMTPAQGVARLRNRSQLLGTRQAWIPGSRRFSHRSPRILRTGCGRC